MPIDTDIQDLYRELSTVDPALDFKLFNFGYFLRSSWGPGRFGPGRVLVGIEFYLGLGHESGSRVNSAFI